MCALNYALTSSAKSVLIVNNSLHYVLPYGIGGKCSEKLPYTEKKRRIFADKKKKKRVVAEGES